MSKVFLAILNMSISASWIVLVILILRILLKKAPKWIFVVLWGIVAIRLICPFSIESVMSLIPSAETINPEIMMDNTPTVNSEIPVVNNVGNTIIGESFSPEVGESVNPLQIIVPILAVVWIVGIVVMLIYMVISYFRIKNKIGTAILLRDNIYQSENVVSPFVLGFLKPKIYLSFDMNERDMEHVIAHENAHICRKDYLWKPIGFFILTLHWFNPLMWISYLLLCRDIELACDEKVIKELNSEQKADYSQALLTCSVNRRVIAACPLAFGEVGVKNRIKSVLNYKKPSFWIIIVAILASIVIAICFLTNPRTTVNDELSVFIDMQVAEHNYSEGHTDGNFIVTHHKILDVNETLNKTTVYMWSMYREYSFKNGEIQLEAGSHIPTVITAKRTGSHGHYELIEYWVPRDGSYYEKDIKGKFPWYLHSKAVDSQRYIEEQSAFCENSAKEYFSMFDDKIKWTYTPSLSYTGHYSKGFSFDFNYTHIEANCTNGEMWDYEAQNQPKDKTLHFEKGRNVYWTPIDSVIEEIPQLSYVTFKIYDGKEKLYESTIVFECVKKDEFSAEYEIYFKESDGLMMLNNNGIIKLTPQGNTSVQTDKTIAEIIDRTKTEEIFTDDAEQPFYVDEKYIYSFPSIKSEYVIVKFSDGEQMTVQNALEEGLVTISDLDKWDILYYKKEHNGEVELDENGKIILITSYPKDIYYSSLDYFQTYYKKTPTEEINDKFASGELVVYKTHYYNTKKLWCAEGYSYKYRLEITGRLNNAAKDSTYIVLSNDENITFEQCWKASGLSSLSTDYFEPEKAIIVGYR